MNKTTDDKPNAAVADRLDGVVSCLKAFTGEYLDMWAFGGFEEKVVSVVANTHSEALGFVLEKFPDTLSDKWTVTEIDTSKPGITLLSERNS